MSTIKPNYTDLDYAARMGPRLRALVEEQLVNDLNNYGVSGAVLKFDWSRSCIEGHCTDFLDGSVENFSGIAVFNSADELVADGWMEFVHDGEFFLAYWEFVETYDGEKKLAEKKQVGIPKHIWQLLPEQLKPGLMEARMKTTFNEDLSTWK